MTKSVNLLKWKVRKKSDLERERIEPFQKYSVREQKGNTEKPMKLSTIVLLLSMTVCQAQFLEGQTPVSEFEYEIKKASYIPQLLELAAATYDRKEFDRYAVVMERIVALQPHFAEHQIRLVQAYALLNEKTKAYDLLIQMQKKGLSYPLGEQKHLENLKNTEVYKYIDEGMVQNSARFGEGKLVYSMDENYSGMLYENIAWDKSTDSFLLGSVRNGEVVRLDDSGKRSVFISAPKADQKRWGVIDLKTDNDKDILWINTASMPQYDGMTNENLGETALLKYQLSTGKLLKEFSTQAEKPNLFSLLHVAKNGDVYVLNAFKRSILKLPVGENQLKPLLQLKEYDDVRALTTDDTGRYLYFADYAKGIYAVDLKGQGVVRLGDPDTMVLGGVEDLIYHERGLLVIQNGLQPQRVIRLKLKNPAQIEKLIPIEAANPNFEVITNGTLTQDHLYYIASSQWSKMDMMGSLLPNEKWTPLKVMRSPFNYQESKREEVLKKIDEFKKQKGIE